LKIECQEKKKKKEHFQRDTHCALLVPWSFDSLWVTRQSWVYVPEVLSTMALFALKPTKSASHPWENIFLDIYFFFLFFHLSFIHSLPHSPPHPTHTHKHHGNETSSRLHSEEQLQGRRGTTYVGVLYLCGCLCTSFFALFLLTLVYVPLPSIKR
jgi:hypothetical protein